MFLRISYGFVCLEIQPFGHPAEYLGYKLQNGVKPFLFCELTGNTRCYMTKIVPYNLLAPDGLGCTVEPLWRGELGFVLSEHLNQL